MPYALFSDVSTTFPSMNERIYSIMSLHVHEDFCLNISIIMSKTFAEVFT